MASNDGQKLLVFGLGFAHHSAQQMQRVLRHYKRLPDAPGNRAALFVELTKLGKELEKDEGTQTEAQLITDWMKTGGEFPLGDAPAPINAAAAAERLELAHDDDPRVRALYSSHPHLVAQRRTQNHQVGQFGAYLERQFGPGRTIADDPQEAPRDGTSDRPAEPPQDGHEEHDANSAMDMEEDTDATRKANGWGAVVEPAPWPEHEPEDSDPEANEDEEEGMEEGFDGDHMEVDEWGAPRPPLGAFGGRFQGRGRTFDDVDDSAIVTEDQDAVPAMPLDVNRAPDVPQLRGDRQWRGNNVHGLGHGLGHGLRGMPRQPEMVGMPGHMQPRRRQPDRRRRPRMEHDLEDEDDDLDGGWGIAAGGFALGPGRTLNDPVPAQGEGFLPAPAVEELTVEESDGDDDVTDVDPQDPEDKNADPMECPICLEEYPPSGFPKVASVTNQCDHPDKACLLCLESAITSVVESGALHLLACPICPQKLTRWNVKAYASKKVYERYKYLKQQASIPGHYISCTNTNCGGSQAHDSNGPTGPMMVCKFCQAQTCAKHRRPWHEGMTCLEYDMDPVQMERLEEEEATAKLLAKEDTSICPKCGQGVTKTDGCDHMSCQCGTEWCYVCSASYENILRIGATAHATFCIYHPNKVNLTKAQQDAARERIMGLVHGGEVSPELTRARDAFRQRRREEMRPKLAEAAEARMKQAQEETKRQRLLASSSSSNGQVPPPKRKVKLVPAWEEGGTTKRSL